MSACKSHVAMFQSLSLMNDMRLPGIQLLSDYGKQWTPHRSKLTGKMPTGQCYKNAYELASTDPHGLTYCEGFAMIPDLIPLEHAWVVDRRGRVIDPTWDKGADYFGVAFDFFWLMDFTNETGHYGVMGMLYTLRKQDVLAKLRSGVHPDFHCNQLQGQTHE